MSGPVETALERLHAAMAPAFDSKPTPELIERSRIALSDAQPIAASWGPATVQKLQVIGESLQAASDALSANPDDADACAVAQRHLRFAIGELTGKHCMCADLPAFNARLNFRMPGMPPTGVR